MTYRQFLRIGVCSFVDAAKMVWRIMLHENGLRISRSPDDPIQCLLDQEQFKVSRS